MSFVRYALGTLCLIVGCISVAMSAPAAVAAVLHPAEISMAFPLTVLLVGLLFIGLAAYLWVRAVKVTPGDHLLSDRRGLLVSLMLVTALLIAGTMIWMMLEPDTWRGAYDGMLDGGRQ